jgi:type IV secretion system protein VirB4
VQAFEMDELMRRAQAAGAVLAVLFHMLERRFDGKPTLLILTAPPESIFDWQSS